MEAGRPARRGRPPLEDEAELSSGPQVGGVRQLETPATDRR
jgi:hypothetical protein